MPHSSVTGRVYDELGFPVAEASLALFRGDPDSPAGSERMGDTRSDVDGVFEFEPVAREDSYFVVARCRGSDQVRGRVEFGLPLELMIERAEVPAEVLVRVVDQRGEPVTDYELTMTIAERRQQLLFRDLPVRDAHGTSEAVVQLLPGRETAVQAMVRSRGYASAFSQERKVSPGGEVEEFLVQLTAVPIRRGIVVDGASGALISGALVRPFGDRDVPMEEVASDHSGSFELASGQALGLTALVVEAQGYAPSCLRGSELGTDEDLLVELGPGGRIAGIVVGPDSLPLQGAWVSAWLPREDGGPQFSEPSWMKTVATDNLGRYLLPPAPTGIVRVGVLSRSGVGGMAQHLDLVREVRVEEGGRTECLLDLFTCVALTGRVELPESLRGINVCLELHRTAPTGSMVPLATWMGREGTEFELRAAEVGVDETLELRIHLNDQHFVQRHVRPRREDPALGVLAFSEEGLAEFFQD